MAPADRFPQGHDSRQANSGSSQAFLRLGHITGAHGLRGALRMRPENPDSDTLAHVARVFLESNGQSQEYRLLDSRRINRSTTRIALEGLDGPEAADALKGAAVMIALDDLPPARLGEFYYFQIIGCEVHTTDGRRIGTVEEVFSTGANDIWVVRDGPNEVLVPVIEDVVKTMDLEQRVVMIEPVPGLLD
jgi:16S rRNA processing protein RimM